MPTPKPPLPRPYRRRSPVADPVGRPAARATISWLSSSKTAAVALTLGLFALVACNGEPSSETATPSASAAAQPEDTAGASPPPSRRRSSESFRNVLLITIDTWRWDAARFAGNERAVTPTLDRVAAAGLHFERAHAHNVLTLPSHSNILTGLEPFRHGVRDNAGFHLRPEHTTVAERLAEAGFATGAVVAAFPLDSSYGLDQGFDLYDDSFPKGGMLDFAMAERSGAEVVDLGLEWWAQHADERRFLWLHLYDPHTPYSPSPEGLRRAGGNAYLGEVADVDSHLSKILSPLLEGSSPDAESTLVIVTADHGEGLGDHGESTHGLFAYESTLRVPLLLWGGDLDAEKTPEPAQHIDLVPTILDAVGLEADPELPGRSLLDAADSSRIQSYFEALNGTLLRGWAPLRGVIETSWQGSGWHADKLIQLPVPELYDLNADPGELENRLPEEEASAEQLRTYLPQESQWPPQAGAVSEEERRALESLGYLGGGGPGELPTTFTVADDPKNLVELDQLLHRFIDEYRRGRLEQATDTARRMVELRPQMGLGHYHLSQVLLERGLKREALRVLSDAYRRGATTPSLVRQLGLTLTEAGRSEEALRVLEPMAESGDLDTLLALAQARIDTGDIAGGRKTIDEVLARDGDNPIAWEAKALASVQAGEWRQALEESDRALGLNANLPLVWNYRGIANYNLGNRSQALEDWQESVRLEPSDFDVLYNLGVVAAEAGRRELAIASLQRFSREAPRQEYGPDIQRASQLLARLR